MSFSVHHNSLNLDSSSLSVSLSVFLFHKYSPALSLLLLLLLALSFSHSSPLFLQLFSPSFSGYSAWQTVSVQTIDEEEEALLREEEAIRLRDRVRNQALGITKVRRSNFIPSNALFSK